MSKKTRLIIIILAVAILLIGGIFGGIKVANNIETQRKLEEQQALELEKEMEIKNAYLQLNYAFFYGVSNDISVAMEDECQYVKLEKGNDPNRVFIKTYVSLEYYE